MKLVTFLDWYYIIPILSIQVTMGKGAKIKLVEKDNDSLFRECPIETYPGLAIQSVTDSSRS